MATLPNSRSSRSRSPASGGLQLVGEPRVDAGVDAADEEAGDAGHVVQPLAASRLPQPVLEAVDEGVRDRLVHVAREQQRDVDVDPLGGQRAHGGDAGNGARHLDHQVAPPDRVPQVACLGDRGLRVVGDAGRHLDADVAVGAAGLSVDRPEDVGDVLDILAGQQVVDLARGQVGRSPADVGDLRVVVVAAADRLFEDRRVRRHARHAVGVDQPRQLAAGDHVAPDEVQPDGLAVALQHGDRICALVQLRARRGHEINMATEAGNGLPRACFRPARSTRRRLRERRSRPAPGARPPPPCSAPGAATSPCASFPSRPDREAGRR